MKHPKKDTSINYFWRDRNGETYTSISENIFRRSAYNEKGFRGFPLAWGTPLIAWIDFTNGGEIMGINSTQMCVRVSGVNLSRIDSFKSQKHKGEYLVYNIIFNDYKANFTKSQLFFLVKKYHSVLHYYKFKNELKESLFRMYFDYGGLMGVTYYGLKELKWKFSK